MASNEAQIRSVDDVRRDPAAVLARFRGDNSFAFSFGDDGRPEAVLLTYDEYDDLDGPVKFDRPGEVLTVEAVQAQLPGIVAAIRSGSLEQPVLWGNTGEAEAVIMSPQQYRSLRGDDEPPAGVVDDPTARTYDTKPLPTSRPLDLDNPESWLGPEGVRIWQELLDDDKRGDDG